MGITRSVSQVYEEWKRSRPTGLPEGYVKVSVILAEHEAERLRGQAALSGDGTASAAIRKRMGLAEVPRGLKKAVHAMMTGDGS